MKIWSRNEMHAGGSIVNFRIELILLINFIRCLLHYFNHYEYEKQTTEFRIKGAKIKITLT